MGIQSYIPGKARFKLVTSENGKEIIPFVQSSIEEGSIIYADKGPGISVLGQKIKDVDGNIIYRCNGEPVMRYNYKLENTKFDKKDNPLTWIHTFISNAKALIHGIYHGVSIGYLDSYLEEYNWRYNMRIVPNVEDCMKELLSLVFKADSITRQELKEIYQN